MRKSFAMLCVLLIVGMYFFMTGFSSCTKPKLQSNGDTSSTIMSTCTACHDTQRICNAMGIKDKDAWNQTVTRMVGKGAALNTDDIPKVVDFLAGLKPGSPPICK